jgi:hypothetical protein
MFQQKYSNYHKKVLLTPRERKLANEGSIRYNAFKEEQEMKRKIGGFLFGCVLIGGLVACVNDSATKVEAKYDGAFKIVSKTKVARYGLVIELKHKETGCRWVYTEGYNNDPTMEQIIGADGLPYCEKVNK